MVKIHKKEQLVAQSGIDAFVDAGLTNWAEGHVSVIVEKNAFKKFLAFFTFGSATLAIEEYFLPDLEWYFKWGIAVFVGLAGMIFYHYQKRPKERKNMF